jgi:hypothetical protein
VTETRPGYFARFVFSTRAGFLSGHLADLLSADRRRGDALQFRGFPADLPNVTHITFAVSNLS